MENWSADTIVRCEYHTCSFRAFLIALALTMFLLYEIRPQCKHVLSHLATGYPKRTWNAGRSIFHLVKPNWRYSLRKRFQRYRTVIGNRFYKANFFPGNSVALYAKITSHLFHNTPRNIFKVYLLQDSDFPNFQNNIFN